MTTREVRIYEKIEDVVWVYNSSSSMVLLEKRKINKSVRYNTTPTMKTRGRPPPSPSSGRKEEEEYDEEEEEEEEDNQRKTRNHPPTTNQSYYNTHFL